MTARKRLAVAVAEVLEARRLLTTVTAPDLTFGSNGTVNTEADVYLTTFPNGDVVAIGTLDTQAITRFLPDGQPDSSFGNDGVVSFTGRYDTKLAAFTASDIFTYGIIGEDTTQQQLRAVSLSTGKLDDNFGKKSVEALPVPSTADGQSVSSSSVSNISATPDGGLLISMNLQLADSTTQSQLLKLNSRGRVDTTFAVNGSLVLPGNITATAWWTSNGIVVDETDANQKDTLTRYTSSGVLDKSFGTSGVVTPPAIFGNDIFEESNGDLLLLQGQSYVANDSDLVRYTASGAIDKSFGTNGIADLPDDIAYNGQHAIDVDPSGRIDIIGDMSVFRLTASGKLDSSFGDDGSYAIDTIEAVPSTVATDASGNVLYGTSESVTRLQTGPAVLLQSNGELLVRGTSADDVLTITQSNTSIDVIFNGKSSTYDSAAVLGIDVNGGDGNNSIDIHVDVACSMLCGDGDDTITTAGGNDTIIAGDGNDSISSGAGNDSIDGGYANNTILGGDGNDTVTATGGDNAIALGGGSDQVSLQSPANVDITGASGKKFIDLTGPLSTIIKLGAGGSYIEDEEDGGGIQSIRIAGGSNTVDIDIGNGNDDIAIGGSGDNLITTGDGANNLYTGDGNDTINLNGTDSVQAGGGNDLVRVGNDSIGSCTIDGGDGNDTLTPGDGSDLVFGGDGNDYIRTGIGNDSLYGGSGSDTIRGGDGDDYLSGGGGKDHLFGQQSNDTLYGGKGNDAIDGGPGSDLISGQAGNDKLFAADGVADSVYGGDGTDSATVDAMLDIVQSVESLT